MYIKLPMFYFSFQLLSIAEVMYIKLPMFCFSFQLLWIAEVMYIKLLMFYFSFQLLSIAEVIHIKLLMFYFSFQLLSIAEVIFSYHMWLAVLVVLLIHSLSAQGGTHCQVMYNIISHGFFVYFFDVSICISGIYVFLVVLLN